MKNKVVIVQVVQHLRPGGSRLLPSIWFAFVSKMRPHLSLVSKGIGTRLWRTGHGCGPLLISWFF